jgi:hypothetical protein
MITIEREKLERAIKAMLNSNSTSYEILNAADALDEALAQPAQEPDVEPACPVCHATPIFSLDRRVHEWSGQCKHCGVEGSPATTEAEAKQKWIVWHHKRSDTTPQQQEPRNFCSRCGKRTADLTVIHTCTPPEGGHQ